MIGLVLLTCLALLLASLVVLRAWRAAPLLVLGGGVIVSALIGLDTRLSSMSATILVAGELVAAATAVTILLVAGWLSYWPKPSVGTPAPRPSFPAAVREFAEWTPPRTRHAYLPTMSGITLAAVAVTVLPRSYPYAAGVIDYAWTMLLAAALVLLVLSETLHVLGCALILLCLALKLIYIATSSRPTLVELTLLSFLPIMLALMVAYLTDCAERQLAAEQEA